MYFKERKIYIGITVLVFWALRRKHDKGSIILNAHLSGFVTARPKSELKISEKGQSTTIRRHPTLSGRVIRNVIRTTIQRR
jgi:hypothetical protein